MRFKELWVCEQESQRETRELPYLDEAESRLCGVLRENRLGKAVRLEQKRIAFDYLLGHLRYMNAPSS